MQLIEAYETSKKVLVGVIMSNFLHPDAKIILSAYRSLSLENLVFGKYHPVGFSSRKLSPPEQKYSPDDHKLLPIFATLKHFIPITEAIDYTY